MSTPDARRTAINVPRRRLSGPTWAIVAAVLALVAVPASGYAVAGQLVNLADPVSSSVARVSDDGQLAVSAQPALSAREFHSYLVDGIDGPWAPAVLAVAAPGEWIGISHITVTGWYDEASVIIRAIAEPAGGCGAATSYFPRTLVISAETARVPTQRVYPVPWTLRPPDPTRRTCLIAYKATVQIGRPRLEINGIVGRPSQLPKG